MSVIRTVMWSARAYASRVLATRRWYRRVYESPDGESLKERLRQLGTRAPQLMQ